MKMSFLRFVLPFAALAFVAPASALAQKNSGSPTGPTVIPAGSFASSYVIDKPGSYVLGGNRTTTSDVTAIQVLASDVTLDLGGFSLIGYNKQNALVAVPDLVDNVEVRNGTLCDAAKGFQAEHGKGVRFVDVRFVNNNYGILSNASQIVVLRCQFKDVGLAIVGPTAVGALIDECALIGCNYGIQVGMYGRVTRSSLVQVNTGLQLGSYATVTDSYLAGGTTALVAGVANTIRNNEIVNYTTGIVHQSTLTVLIGNRLANATNVYGPVYVNGGGNVLQ